MNERLTQKPDDLEYLEQTAEKKLESVLIEGLSPKTGYAYGFRFMFITPRAAPIIKIDTEPRQSFLEKGTEQQAQDALVDVAQQTRRKSGGSFSIHPWYGAVLGTKLTPLVPWHLVDEPEPSQNLKMFIYLSDAAYLFDNTLTQKYRKITEAHDRKSPRLSKYLQESRANPNQQNRDAAIINQLDEIWHGEFARYHQGIDVPEAMKLTPQNIVALMRGLEDDAVLKDIKVSSIHPFRNFP